MTLIEKKIESYLLNAIKETFENIEIDEVSIQPSNNLKFGDYQTNFAMVNAKKIGDNPRKIAEKIINNIKENEIIEKIEIAGPGFINIFLKTEYLANELKKIGEKFDFDFLDKDGDVVIDYSSPNIAKRMHIGHLRSTVIGDSIKRIYKFLGYNIIADNHIGDWGTQFGKLIVGYKNWLDKYNYEKNPIEELERIYVEFSKRSEEDNTLEDLAREELRKLQQGDEEAKKLWEEFIKVSLQEYDKIYKRMDIEFDTYYGESFYHDIMPVVIEELKAKGIAKEDDGALVVFFDEEKNLHPCIVQKKDGAYLYSTSDLATIKYRRENYNLNKIIYVTDERQQDHFRQIFEITDMLNWKDEKHHIWFGIMRFADGIFSTRKGNVIKLNDLLDESVDRAYKIVAEKNPTLSEEEKRNIAEIVGVGAVKYADLSQNRTSPIIFEWDKILSFEGNTSPYLQYSYARIRSIMRNANENNIKVDYNKKLIFTEESEINLIKFLFQFPRTVILSANNFKPNLLADYIFELSKKFNTFYNALPILKGENEEIINSRLILCDKVSFIIKEGLNLLGINTVERM
ncbi:MAG: arginyl-tRNA synthetase [Fusobacteriales bacterium]|jgi:arginyl-tRNA synthetase|nr:arginyl-tRNA synthetase [Fusobacteriales bacterium]